MNFIEQLQLMDKLSPYADEIIANYNEKNNEFTPTNIDIFNKHSDTILEIVGGSGINARYENGKVFIDFD